MVVFGVPVGSRRMTWGCHEIKHSWMMSYTYIGGEVHGDIPWGSCILPSHHDSTVLQKRNSLVIPTSVISMIVVVVAVVVVVVVVIPSRPLQSRLVL